VTHGQLMMTHGGHVSFSFVTHGQLMMTHVGHVSFPL